MQSLKNVLERTVKMTTMKEALQDVNYNECNDFEKSFYDKGINGSYTPSEKQMAVINKMPKISGGHKRTDPFEGQKPQPKNDFNYGANIQTSEIEKNLQLIDRAFDLMEEYPNLKELDQENKRAIAISCAINQSRADYFNGKK
tara:strand:+ start:249 stop:677 length:429 start_codon:yes stop_codon:yes gene_type:complete